MLEKCFSYFTKTLVLSMLTLVMTSCLYRMPNDEDYNVLPVTNNPSVTRDAPSQTFMPGVNY